MQISLGLVRDCSQTYPLRQSLDVLQRRKQAGLLVPLPPAMQVLPEGQVESSPVVHGLLQYPPSVQAWLMHNWLPQSAAVVHASPTVAPQALASSAAGTASLINPFKISPLPGAPDSEIFNRSPGRAIFWRSQIRPRAQSDRR